MALCTAAYSAPLAVSIALIIVFALFVNQHSKQGTTLRLGRHPHKIPHIVHQTWIDDNVPEVYQPWQQSWKSLQPAWTYRLWTDVDNDQLVTSKFRWFRPTFDRLPVKIMQVDAVRYMYLYTYGGVYADLDMMLLRPIDQLLANHTIVLGTLSNDSTFEHNIPNAFMASAPRHDFWLLCLNLITAQLFGGKHGAEVITGPILLKDAVALYQEELAGTDITLLPPKVVFNDWRRKPPSCRFKSDKFNATNCMRHYKDNFVMSFWTHNWLQEGES